MSIKYRLLIDDLPTPLLALCRLSVAFFQAVKNNLERSCSDCPQILFKTASSYIEKMEQEIKHFCLGYCLND